MCKSEWWANKKRWFRDSFPGIMRGFIMVVIVAAVVCCIIGFFSPKFEYLDENNLVITFLGALAAFVVISNYAQLVEIRNKTDEKMDQMKNELDELHKKLDQFENLSERIESNFIVDINRVGLAVSKAETDERIIELLEELTVYRDLNDSAIRWKIIEVLNSIHGRSAKSETIAAKVMSIAFSLAPMGDNKNEVLGDLLMTGYYLIDDALCFGKPKNGAYGFTIMKLVAKITKNATEAKDYLNSLKNKFKDDLKIRYIDTFIKDLDNSNLSWPRFDKDVQEWFDKNGNN